MNIQNEEGEAFLPIIQASKGPLQNRNSDGDRFLGNPSGRKALKVCVLGLLVGIVIGFSIPLETFHRRARKKNLLDSGKNTTVAQLLPYTDPDPDLDPTAPWPRIAWLMSFPNSGTSYTIGLVRSATLHYTASNYGQNNVDKDLGVSMPVFDSSPYGPFWSDPGKPAHPSNKNLTYPQQGYVLTKTHCGARCMECEPSDYIETQHQFLMDCLSGRHIRKGADGKLVHPKGNYDAGLVYKAIHLFRNPFNNAVARFHLHIKHKTEYTNDRNGFRAFCKFENNMFESKEVKSPLIEEDILRVIRNVPCHAEFIKYVRWHNSAFTVTNNLQLPTMMLHYEDYGTNFNKTLLVILDFLGHELAGSPRPFVPGHSYLDLYQLVFLQNDNVNFEESNTII